MGHLPVNAKGCQVLWDMVAEVALWGDAWFLHYLGRRLLPDVCGYHVFRIASVGVIIMCLEGLCFACRILPITCFSKLLGFNDSDKVKYRNVHLSH